ncbi:MAG: hypothetical protein HQ517_11445 [SAR324 cluster bacterium]|nr:hypothetical protein [SAR324 cluster bacterium]
MRSGYASETPALTTFPAQGHLEIGVPLNSYTSIHSVDFTDGLTDTSQSGAFLPGRWGAQTNIYANQDLFVISSNGWKQNAGSSNWQPQSYLIAFKLALNHEKPKNIVSSVF